MGYEIQGFDGELTELMVSASPVVADGLILIYNQSIDVEHFQTSSDCEATLARSCNLLSADDKVKV